MPYKSGRGHPGYKSPLMKFLLKDTDGYNPLSPITFNGGHISAAVAPRLTSPCGRSCRIPEASVDARQTLPPPPSSPARSMTIDVEPDPDGFVFFFPRKAKQNKTARWSDFIRRKRSFPLALIVRENNGF